MMPNQFVKDHIGFQNPNEKKCLDKLRNWRKQESSHHQIPHGHSITFGNSKEEGWVIASVCDYQKLNSVTHKDSFPLPWIDELLDCLGKAKYFTTLDLFAGYHQIEIAEEDRSKTAFSSFAGLYHWNTMPFGLACTPPVFQRTLEFILLGLNWKNCLVYIDDIICFSPDFETHLRDLSLIFQRFHEGNLKCKPKKCFFVRPKVPYLGFIISKNGLEPDEEKIRAVKEMPSPKDITTVKQALGFLQFYRKFIESFAHIAAPLYKLQRKGEQFKWTEECETAFRTLLDKLIQKPILPFPDFEKEFLLAMDASGVGVGAVLSQVAEDGLEHPVTFASRSSRSMREIILR